MDTIVNEVSEVDTDHQIILQIKNVCGIAKVYPVCQKAKVFARLTNKKTFSPNDLKSIAYLGFLIWFENVPTQSYYKYNHTNFVGFQKYLDDWDN